MNAINQQNVPSEAESIVVKKRFKRHFAAFGLDSTPPSDLVALKASHLPEWDEAAREFEAESNSLESTSVAELDVGMLCSFCEQRAVAEMPQSSDRGRTVEMVRCCGGHRDGWWDGADWDGRHLEINLLEVAKPMSDSCVSESDKAVVRLARGGSVTEAFAGELSPLQSGGAEKQYLVFSQSEGEATTIRDGFWSNDIGWGDFTTATRFSALERKAFDLPASSGGDAKWVAADELASFFKEQEQRARLASAERVLFEQTGIRNPVAAKQFFDELLESVETLNGIVEQYGTRGARTLADLMLLQNAIGKGTFIDHYPGESAVMEVVTSLPSGDRWVRYVTVAEDGQQLDGPCFCTQ